MWRSRWRCVIKPAYSFSFLLSINIFVWQNVLYFLDAPHMFLPFTDGLRTCICPALLLGEGFTVFTVKISVLRIVKQDFWLGCGLLWTQEMLGRAFGLGGGSCEHSKWTFVFQISRGIVEYITDCWLLTTTMPREVTLLFAVQIWETEYQSFKAAHCFYHSGVFCSSCM